MDLRSLIAPRLVAHAHCDIPCGIYDPTAAKIAADTVAKMVEKITGATGTDDASRNTFIRSVTVKDVLGYAVPHLDHHLKFVAEKRKALGV